MQIERKYQSERKGERKRGKRNILTGKKRERDKDMERRKVGK